MEGLGVETSLEIFLFCGESFLIAALLESGKWLGRSPTDGAVDPRDLFLVERVRDFDLSRSILQTYFTDEAFTALTCKV